jgi:hypothetical protein
MHSIRVHPEIILQIENFAYFNVFGFLYQQVICETAMRLRVKKENNAQLHVSVSLFTIEIGLSGVESHLPAVRGQHRPKHTYS